MDKVFVLLSMIFLHIVDDFKLQVGVLVNLKQKKYWEENAPDSLYRYDYIMGLIMHGLSWSFMMMLPIAIALRFHVDANFLVLYVFNAIVHAVIDDLKANKGQINLIVDQLCHVCQIIGTFWWFCII